MFKLGLPGVIGALIFSMLGMIEAWFVSQYGTETIAAVALVFPLIMLAAMLSAGAVGGAVSGATARALGSGDQPLAESVLVSSIVISVLGGLLMTLLVLTLGPALFALASDSSVVVALAQDYASIVFPGIGIFWLVNMLSSFLRGTGDMVRPAFVALAMVCSYLLAAVWLMPPAHSEPVVAIRSAALSMVLSYSVAVVVAFWFVLRRSQSIRLRWSSYRSSVLVALLKQGSLAGSQSVMTILYTLVATLLFGRFGVEWLAGYGLAVRLELIMVPLIFGLGGSLIAIVGVHVGAGLRHRAIQIAWKGIVANAVIVGVIGLLFAGWPHWWCETFGRNPEMIGHCEQSLQFIGPTYAFFAMGLGCYFASQGLNTLVPPVVGALLRLLIVSTGLFWVTGDTSPTLLLSVVAFAVVSYGGYVALVLRMTSWSKSA